jgi:hypothetical protein
VWWDDGHGTAVKGNDDGEWSSDGLVLRLERRQNGDAVKWWGEWPRLRWSFITMKGESRKVREEWPAAVVQIQCFGFGSRGEAMGQSVARR